MPVTDVSVNRQAVAETWQAVRPVTDVSVTRQDVRPVADVSVTRQVVRSFTDVSYTTSNDVCCRCE